MNSVITCSHCPCKISRNRQVCPGCINSISTSLRSLEGTSCVVCNSEICVEHADPRAVAQNTCQSCLANAEFSSSEEDYVDDELSGSSSDEELNVRVLPEWMQGASLRHSPAASPLFIPSYCPLSSPPIHVIHQSADLSVRDTCSICLEQFSRGEAVTALSCHVSHVFHSPCISSWLRVSRACPMCKQT